jgi:hypothetical protein
MSNLANGRQFRDRFSSFAAIGLLNPNRNSCRSLTPYSLFGLLESDGIGRVGHEIVGGT